LKAGWMAVLLVAQKVANWVVKKAAKKVAR
jgi:hypothetical protein